MKILFAASEAVPFCKTGGLADVAGSLPPALAAAGHEVKGILPLYEGIGENWRSQMTFLKYFNVTLAWRQVYCGIFEIVQNDVTYWFVDNEYYFKRWQLYGHFDDCERYAYFSRAVLEACGHLNFSPDVVHCNDWQTALVPIYLLEERSRTPQLANTKSVYTIHNIEYQGRYGKETLEDLFGLAPGWFTDGTIAMDGDVNLLKGALMTCDAITAVSPTYAQELRYAYFAHGMESVMQRNAGKLYGVLNGIDMERYDPAKDEGIIAKYTPARMTGKAKNKLALQRQMRLSEEAGVPVIGIVSRLVSHKGLDLVCKVFDQIMDLNCQFVVLGSGDWNYEQFFEQKLGQYKGRMGLYRGYNEELAMSIYSGADLLLMPSKSEPCGLAQMIAMRYGTVPIVRETGGLKDTVHPYEAWCGAGNGFTFADYNSGDMLYVIRQAVDLYYNNPTAFKALRKAGMTEDFSWKRSAEAYNDIYRTICS